VAVRQTPETSSSPRLFDHLAVSALAGVVYVLAALWVVFFGLPGLWWGLVGERAVTVALLGLIMLVAATALGVFGVRLLNSQAQPGTAHSEVDDGGHLGVGRLRRLDITWSPHARNRSFDMGDPDPVRGRPVDPAAAARRHYPAPGAGGGGTVAVVPGGELPDL